MTTPARGIVIVTPALDEAMSLPELHRRIGAALGSIGRPWRWLIVDDASHDETFSVAERLARGDARIAVIRLARRGGSHGAILAGLGLAAADPSIAAAAVMASDLDDPPEALPALLAAFEVGAPVVWAERRARPGLSLARRAAARAVHIAVRLALPASRYPWSGADMGIFGRPVLDALARDRRPVGNVFVRIARLRLPAARVPIDKAIRRRGTSRWTPAQLARFAQATLSEAIGLGRRGPAGKTGIEAASGWVAQLTEKQ